MSNFIVFIFLLVFLAGCSDNPTQTTINPPSVSSYVPALDDMVMYEVNLRAFSQLGTIEGLIQRLDSVKALGVNVLWIMPIYPVGILKGINSPYCIRNYTAVADEYGSIADMKKLTDSAHAKGMAVILDWVANHTSWDNPWIQNTSWYTKDANGAIIHPSGTNWQDVADLNYDSKELRDTMIASMRWWIDSVHIDGFRCDYADGVPADFWKSAITKLDSTTQKSLLFLAEGTRSDHFASGFDLIFSWNYYSSLKSVFSGANASSITNTHIQEYANVPAGKHRLRFTTNHDESAWDNSPVVLFKGLNGALAASVITIFMDGVPFLYNGQEVGRASKTPFFSKSPIQWNDNPQMLSAYKNIMHVFSNTTAARKGINTYYSNANVVCFKKSFNTEEILVVVNVRNQQTTMPLAAELKNTQWFDAFDHSPLILDSSLTLQPYQYHLLKSNQ